MKEIIIDGKKYQCFEESEINNPYRIKSEYPKIISFRSYEKVIHTLQGEEYRCEKYPNYEIFAMLDFVKNGKAEIYQVQTSETEVFTVGDKISHNSDVYTIKSFSVQGENIYAHTEIKHVQCAVFVENIFLMDDSIKKAPTPLFVTEDSVEIYEGNEFYFVDSFWEIGKGKATTSYKKITSIKEFSTREAAEKYIKQNKPRFSVKDVEDALTMNCGRTTGDKIGNVLILDEEKFRQKLGI